MNPTAELPVVLIFHAFLACLVFFLILPCGIGLALKKSKWHRYVQGTGALILLFAVLVAATAGGSESDDAGDDMNSAKRHLLHSGGNDSPVGHAAKHATLGVAIVVAVFLQASLGLLAKTQVAASAYSLYASIHRGMGFFLIGAAFPLQAVLGLDAMFDLCDERLSGLNECVGHFLPGAGIFYGAMFYGLYMTRIEKDAMRRHYTLILVENILLAANAFGTVAYSIYSEYPWSKRNQWQHLVAGSLLSVLSTASLYSWYKSKKGNQPVAEWVARGTSLCCTAVVTGILFLWHMQVNSYATAIHYCFSAAFVFTGVFRVFEKPGLVALTLLLCATTFISAQRGFAILFDQYYSKHLTIGIVIALDALIALFFFVYGWLWARLFLAPPTSMSIPVSIEEDGASNFTIGDEDDI